jgi:hypothetical protein
VTLRAGFAHIDRQANPVSTLDKVWTHGWSKVESPDDIADDFVGYMNRVVLEVWRRY